MNPSQPFPEATVGHCRRKRLKVLSLLFLCPTLFFSLPILKLRLVGGTSTTEYLSFFTIPNAGRKSDYDQVCGVVFEKLDQPDEEHGDDL